MDPVELARVRQRQLLLRSQTSAPQTAVPAAGASAPSAAPAAPEAKPNRWLNAVEGIFGDISAGLQGVNPVALSEKRGQAVGVLKDGYVDVDGVREPLENYPQDRFVTRQEGGQSYIYPRTPDIDESRAASAGRLLGYGAMEGFRSPVQASQAAQEAADVGVTPSFSMQGPASALTAAAGKQFAPTAGRFIGDTERVTGELGEAAGKLAARIGPATNEVGAGGAIKRGAETFVSGVRNRRDALWGEVDKAIPKGTQIVAPETVQWLEDQIGSLAATPNIAKSVGNAQLEGWLADLKSGDLTWTALRQLRTEIGDAVGKITAPEGMRNVSQGKLNAIYGKLTTDLEAAAGAAGASEQWARANKYHAASAARIEDVFQRFLKADTPEKAYSTLTGMAGSGSRADIGTLTQVFRSLPKDEAAEVAATVIRNLGNATPGVQGAAGDTFSPATFLTNWNKMNPTAREVIARSGLDKGVGAELSKLARVMERAKDAAGKSNTSNTGNVGSFLLGALGVGTLGVPGTIAAAGAAHLTARALTNETFLKALNNAATGDTAGLRAIANGKGPLAIEAATVLRLQAPEATSPLPAPAIPAPAIR